MANNNESKTLERMIDNSREELKTLKQKEYLCEDREKQLEKTSWKSRYSAIGAVFGAGIGSAAYQVGGFENESLLYMGLGFAAGVCTKALFDWKNANAERKENKQLLNNVKTSRDATLKQIQEYKEIDKEYNGKKAPKGGGTLVG